mmetsp:Transcript_6617/g.7196  ORF Transcript_6617/g.7196 Transcript_6617/m.7196 type:complete len:790 (+) Transcript_6617:34-2403(+)
MMVATQSTELAILFLFWVACLNAQNVFRIGVVYVDQPLGPIQEPSLGLRYGQQMWRDTVNARNGLMINGTNYMVELIYLGSIFNGEAAAKATQQLIDDNDLNFLFLPQTSVMGIASAVVANENKIPSILPASSNLPAYRCDSTLQPPCKEPFGRRFEYAVGMITPAHQAMTEGLNLLAIHNVKKIAIFWEDNPYSYSMAVGIRRNAAFLGFEVVLDEKISDVNVDIAALVPKLKEANPEAVVGATFLSCFLFMKTAREQDFNANAYLLSTPCLKNNEELPSFEGDDAKYVTTGGILWDRRVKSDLYNERDPSIRYHHFPSNDSIASPELFAQLYEAKYNQDPSTGMSGYTEGYIVQYAVERANSLDPRRIQDAIDSMVIDGFCGEFQLDLYGENLGRNAITLQVSEERELEIVAPLFAATEGFVYPAPKWNERKITYGWYKRVSEHVMLALVCLVIVLTGVFILWIILYRNHRVIRASQPYFVVATLIGSIFIYSSVFFWTLHTNDFHCNIVRWLLCIGFGLMYGALFSRIYKLAEIFRSDTVLLSTVSITPIVAFIVSVEVVLLALWTGISRSHAELREEAPYIKSDDFYACSNSTTADIVFFSLVMIFNAGILVIGLYWVFRIWRIKSALLNESRLLGLSVYTLASFVAILIIVQVFGSDQREVAFVLRSFCLILGPFISVLLLLVPRALYMRRDDPILGKSKVSDSSKLSTTSAETKILKQQVLKLKEQSEEYQERIKELEDALNSKPKTRKRQEKRRKQKQENIKTHDDDDDQKQSQEEVVLAAV